MTRRFSPNKCDDTAPAFAGDPAYPYVGKLVHELTLAQIGTLDCGKPARRVPRAEVVRGNKIATLPQVFTLADSYRADAMRYNIETKVEADQPGASAEPQEFVDVILAAVRSAGKVDRVEIQSFDWRTLPHGAPGRAVNSVGGLVQRARPGQPSSPWLAGVNAAVIGDPLVGARMVGANIVSPDYQLVTGEPYVDRAHALGLKVIPWTVNDAAAMRQQIGFRVDGIITDYPTVAARRARRTRRCRCRRLPARLAALRCRPGRRSREPAARRRGAVGGGWPGRPATSCPGAAAG